MLTFVCVFVCVFLISIIISLFYLHLPLMFQWSYTGHQTFLSFYLFSPCWQTFYYRSTLITNNKVNKSLFVILIQTNIDFTLMNDGQFYKLQALWLFTIYNVIMETNV